MVDSSKKFALNSISGATAGDDIVPASNAHAFPPSVLNRFQILNALGAGGMGQVFRAFDLELDETVALKVLHASAGGSSSTLRDQLRREVKATRRISSPHVIRVYESGTDGNFSWFSMEYVRGESLADRLQREPHLGLHTIREVGTAIGRGLMAAHEVGVIHRDLKPANVLMSADRVTICDFGLAHLDWKHNETRSAVGTPAYFAPEQLNGGRVTPATDIFSLGVMLYELTSGTLPWKGDSLLALAMSRLRDVVVDPRELARNLPDQLAELILQCLDADPERRPASAAEVTSRLIEAVGDVERTGSTRSTPNSAVISKDSVSVSAQPAGLPRLVVLPFASVGPPSDLSIGLAEDVTAALIPHKQLRTLAARVARQQSLENLNLAEIGRRLNVNYVIDGSVRRNDGLWRIQVTMTNCATDTVVWNLTLDCDEMRARHVHDEIAFAVAQEMLEDVAPVKTMPQVTNPLVLQAYVAGRRRYNEAMASFDPATMRDAVTYFERAVAQAPTEPLLVPALAIAVSGLLAVDAVIEPGALQKAQHLASRAIQLAPQSGEAWTAQGLVQLYSGHPSVAANAFRRAMSLAPSLPEPRVQLAVLLADAGWLADARQQLDVAYELGGDAASILGEMARIAQLSGNIEEAIRLRADLDLRGIPPYSWWRGVYAGALVTNDATRLHEVYREMCEPHRQPLPPFVEALRIVLGSVIGVTSSEAHLALLPTIGFGEGATAVRKCRTLMLLMELKKSADDLQGLLELLEHAVNFGLCNVAWMERASALERVRALPAYANLRRRVTHRAARVVDAYCGDSARLSAVASGVGLDGVNAATIDFAAEGRR